MVSIHTIDRRTFLFLARDRSEHGTDELKATCTIESHLKNSKSTAKMFNSKRSMKPSVCGGRRVVAKLLRAASARGCSFDSLKIEI